MAIDIVRVPPSRLNTLASQAAQTLISPASQVSRSQNRKTGVQLKRIIWGLPRSAQNPNPATPGGERYRLISIVTRRYSESKISEMSAFLKRMRWAALLTCYLIVVKVCRLFHIALPMDSFWRPHNLSKFRPYYVAPRTEIHFRMPPQPR